VADGSHDIVADCEVTLLAVKPRGAAGATPVWTVDAVIGVDAAEPIELRAMTSKSYDRPVVSPVIVTDVPDIADPKLVQADVPVCLNCG